MMGRWRAFRIVAAERPGLWLLAAAAASTLLLFGVLVMAIREIPQLLAFDRAALLALSDNRSAGLDAAMRGITVLGSTAWVGSFAVIVGVVLLLRRDYRGTAQMLLASFGSWALMMVAKPLIGRDRPDMVQPLADVAGYSFPSGHALMATAAYLTFAFVAQKYARRQHAKVFFMALACLAILVAGCSRVYLGVHYPSDVLGGILLGIFWALLLEGAMRKPGENDMIP